MVQYAKLGDLGEIFIGLTYKPENVASEGTIVLRSSNIQDGELDFNDIVRVNCMVRENLFVKPNDILMCSRNGSAKLVGKCTLLPTMSEPVTFGAFMTIIRTPYNGYLRHFFDSAAFRNQIKGSATTTINQITRKMLDDVLVPIFDDKTQNQISEQFSSIDRLISLRKQQLAKLDELVKARFVELFGDKRYPEDTLLNLCNIIDYRGKTPEKVESGLPFITAKNVRMHQMNLEPREYISKETYDKVMVRGFPKEGDVVFTTEAPLGNVCRIPHFDTEFYIGQRIVTLQTEKLEPIYLEYALSSDDFKMKYMGKSSGSTVTGIRVRLLEQLTIPVPPMELQKQFAAFVEQTDKSKLAIQQSLDKLETLKKSLMQKYFG